MCSCGRCDGATGWPRPAPRLRPLQRCHRPGAPSSGASTPRAVLQTRRREAARALAGADEKEVEAQRQRLLSAFLAVKVADSQVEGKLLLGDTEPTPEEWAVRPHRTAPPHHSTA